MLESFSIAWKLLYWLCGFSYGGYPLAVPCLMGHGFVLWPTHYTCEQSRVSLDCDSVDVDVLDDYV